MKKLLFTTLPSNDLGLLARTVPVGKELAERGYEVAFCNPAPAPMAVIEEAGLTNLPPRMGPFPTTFAPSTTDVWNIDHFSALIGLLDENHVRGACEAIMGLITDYGADAIVDSWNVTACLAAKALRKPLVTLIQADMHPANPGFIWWKEPPPDIPTPVPVLNRVLPDHDLPPISKTAELLVGDLTLVAGTPETDPVPAEANVNYVGPILWQRPGAKLPESIEALGKGKPLVWVYTGNPTYGPIAPWADSIVVLDSCAEALAGEDVDVVLTTGHHPLSAEQVAALPSNFHYEPWLPGMAMAEKSDLLIHHGGHGSCMTGLCAGTPAVIIPTYSERESNARRVAALGAGNIVLLTESGPPQKRVSVEELRAKVRQVLSDPSYKAGARRIATSIRAYGGAAEAARLIDRFAQGL
ncbi:MAG: glycosyltransferase [Dehalococcoidia bacterium]